MILPSLSGLQRLYMVLVNKLVVFIRTDRGPVPGLNAEEGGFLVVGGPEGDGIEAAVIAFNALPGAWVDDGDFAGRNFREENGIVIT